MKVFFFFFFLNVNYSASFLPAYCRMVGFMLIASIPGLI
jgi:hypothetical protein